MMELKAKHPKMVMKNPIQRTGGIDQIQADWEQQDETAVDYIKNKPVIPEVEPQIQSDWEQENQEAVDYIKNKPENLSDFNNDMGFLTHHQDISGKADKTTVNSHINDTTAHITANERTYWNSKADYASVAEVFEDMTADINRKANTADLASVAFSGDYGDLINKPVEPEITTYDIQFNNSVALGMGKFVFTNTEDSNDVICEKLRNGTANINRIIDLTYDPVDSISSSLAFEDYELYDIQTTATAYALFYKRVIAFQPMQFNNPQLDTLYITYNINTQAFNIYHSYHALAPSIIIYTDFEFADQPYPHAIKFSNSGGRWGKTNLATVKNTRAGFSSDFNYILRVSTHGDNVWLRPTETVSANALPRFIGESEKLRKRVVVTFDNWTDSDHPTATMDLQDLAEPQIQADWNQADTTALDYIKNKPTAVSAFTNDAGYLTAHQDISGKADKTARVEKTASDTTASIDPNKLYVFPTMTALTISLNAGDSSVVNEYHFIFTSGTTATNLTLPATVKKPYGFTVEANTTYEVSIMENCMVVQRWEA